MAITSLLNSNSNPSLISQRRQFFHDKGNLCCIRISGVKITNFMDSGFSRNNANTQIVISNATSKGNPLTLQHVAESFESTGQNEHDCKKECVSGLRGRVMKFLAIAGLLIHKNADAIFRPGLKPVVVKLQVCFVVGERDLKRHLKELERISKMSILDSLSHEERLQRRVDQAMKFGVASKDLADKLEATSNFLLGLSYHSISCDASVEVKKSIQDAEDCCKQLCIEELKKFDGGTLARFEETCMVVTLIVAAEVDGLSRLPPIYDAPDLRWTLNRLQNITKDDKIHAVELFWAPEDEKHIMSSKDYHSAYPLLKPLRKRF